jgi:hypothetical protein
MLDDEQVSILADSVGNSNELGGDGTKPSQEQLKAALKAAFNANKGELAGKLGIRKSIGKTAKA